MKTHATLQKEITPILLKILESHPFNWDAVAMAGEELGEPAGSVRLIVSNNIDNVLKNLYLYFENLLKNSIEEEDLSALRTHEKIRKIIELHFISIEPHKKALRSILHRGSLLSSPITFTNMLYQTVSHMWYAAGDQSTDYNFYTKRLILSAVYTPTLFYWLEGNNLEETMKYCDKKLSQVSKVPKLKNQIKTALKSIFPF